MIVLTRDMLLLKICEKIQFSSLLTKNLNYLQRHLTACKNAPVLFLVINSGINFLFSYSHMHI